MTYDNDNLESITDLFNFTNLTRPFGVTSQVKSFSFNLKGKVNKENRNKNSNLTGSLLRKTGTGWSLL